MYNNQMYSKTVLFEVTILLNESLIEELRGWLTINCGEIVKVEKPRNKNKPVPGKTALSRTLSLIKLSTQYSQKLPLLFLYCTVCVSIHNCQSMNYTYL